MKKIVFWIISIAAWGTMGGILSMSGVHAWTWRYWAAVLSMSCATMFFPNQSLYSICCRHEFHLIPGQKISLTPNHIEIPDELHFVCCKCGRYKKIEINKKKEK